MQIDVINIGQLVVTIISGAAFLASTFVNLRIRASMESTKRDVNDENTKLRNEINNHLENLRREFGTSYVQVPIATEQQKGFLHRLERLENELSSVRSNHHSLADKFQGLILGQLAQMQASLVAWEKRQEHLERRLDSMDGIMHDCQRRLSEYDRRTNRSS